MPRPSLKAERRKQILSAAQKCVAHYGIAGLTLEKVAEIANLARPLIRHNIGNREELIKAVTEQFLDSSKQKINILFDHLPSDQPFNNAVDMLFDLNYSDTTTMLVAEALIAESANDPDIASLMRNWLNEFVSRFAEIARKEFPNAESDQLNTVVTGITGIYFTLDSLTPLGELKSFNAHSHKAAKRLISTLKSIH